MVDGSVLQNRGACYNIVGLAGWWDLVAVKFGERQLLWLLVSFLVGASASAAVLALSNRARPAPIVITPAILPTVAATGTPGPLRIYVSGAVLNPGVYRLPPDSIAADAIEQAGGLAADAARDWVNLAGPLADGMQLYVPSEDEIATDEPEALPPAISTVPPPTTESESAGGGASGGLININRADAEELEQLPRIGPSTAQKIIDHREQNGPFSAIEEIMNVSGIGEATFEQLKPLITVDG